MHLIPSVTYTDRNAEALSQRLLHVPSRVYGEDPWKAVLKSTSRISCRKHQACVETLEYLEQILRTNA
jgi:hypothetical protein